MLSSTPGRPIRRFLLLACLAGVAASFMLASVASAAPIPTNVKLSQSAQFTLSYQIDVQVALSCTAGYGFFVNVNVVQPQGFGFTMFGGGSSSGQCTGQQQKLAVPVYTFGGGPWLLGDASAGVVACAGSCADDTSQIHIGL